MIYCFDIDGTICSNTEGTYEQAVPFPEVIAEVNALKAAGHRIILFTARGTVSGIDWRPITEKQLLDWGVLYDQLHFGKPAADVYIDDKGVNIAEFRLSRFGKTSPDATPAIFIKQNNE